MISLNISRDVEFYTFGQKPLAAILKLEALPFARKKVPFRQLEYVEEYVKELIQDYAPTNGEAAKPATIVCETHYIDRDHIEDHSVFYSRNLFPYHNHCRRLHFFCLDESSLRRRIQEVLSSAEKGESRYREACEKLSNEAYLGFSVIRPLDGCPVGRTVLRTYPQLPKGPKSFKREFRCTRQYRTHLLGVELSVSGLAFQQQDAGVAACATTAVWSSLHHLRNSEEVAAATPAQITSLAARNDLPFGRPMPSEGLSLGQMCLAIQAIGVSPSLLRVDDYRTARTYIYSAAMSGMAPILVIATGKSRHAVTVTGVKLFSDAEQDVVEGIADISATLKAIYVHDDRVGPYSKGIFESITDANSKQEKPLLKLGRAEPQPWHITHVLLAMHPKIRLSFKGLHDAGLEVAKRTHQLVTVFFKLALEAITLETRIVRGFKYVEDLMLGNDPVGAALVEKFTMEVPLPRYVGLIRVSTSAIGTVDVLLDTTGTPRNLHAIAVIARQAQGAYSNPAVRFLAKEFRAKPILPIG